jgi:hypothetical protein
MSVWNYVFDNDWSQRADIESLKNRARRSVSLHHLIHTNSKQKVVALQNDLAEMTLLLRAMYVYLKGAPGFDAKRFGEIVSRIDLMDGVKDGKVTKRVAREKSKPARPPMRRH